MDNRKREVQEALDAADNVLHCLSVARGQLSSASAFGMLDIASNNTADPFGLNMTARGVVPSVLKYSELQNASHQLTIAKAALDRLRAEVDDVIALPEVAQFDLISIADIIFDGLDFHNNGRISYSEFLSAMVSSKDFNKEEKIKSVFNLLKESEQNNNYITYDSLENAAKALNLNINKERLKNCFKKLNGYIGLEKFQKLILDEDTEDNISENSKYLPTTSNHNQNKQKRNSSTLARKKTS